MGPSSRGEPGHRVSALLASNSCPSCRPNCCSCSRFFMRKIFGILTRYCTLHSILFVSVTVFQNSQVSIVSSHCTVGFLALFILCGAASGTCSTVGRCERTESQCAVPRHRCPNRSAPARAGAAARPARARAHTLRPYPLALTQPHIPVLPVKVLPVWMSTHYFNNSFFGFLFSCFTRQQ